MSGMRRADSYDGKYMGGSEPGGYNRNTEWMKEQGGMWMLGLIYPLCLVGIWATVFTITSMTVAYALSVTNITHGVLSFALLHWIKGSPDFYDQGTFNGLTYWEQIDNGEPWTWTKKYLILVPTVLTLLTLVASNYNIEYVAVNLPIWLTLVVAKLPMMEGVRILGINSTPGIDDDQKMK